MPKLQDIARDLLASGAVQAVIGYEARSQGLSR